MAYIIEGDSSNYIFWVFSHAIVDGYSVSLLKRELEENIIEWNSELQFDMKEEKNKIIKAELTDYDIELKPDYGKNISNKITKRLVVFSRNDSVKKEQLIYSIARMISTELDEDIIFSTLINLRMKYNSNYHVVRDMHDEIIYLYRKGEDNVETYKDTMKKQRGRIEQKKLKLNIPFQFNYEIEEVQTEEMYGNNIISIVNQVMNDFEDRIDDRIMSINISDNLENLRIEIVSCLKESIIDKIICRMEKEYGSELL